MREFELLLDKSLERGLYPSKNCPTNSQWLDDCLGWRCGKCGLWAHKLLTNPFPALDLHYSWPFPQVLGEGNNIILINRNESEGKDYIYFVMSDSDVQLAATTNSAVSSDEPISMYSLASFGKYNILTNGSTILVTPPSNELSFVPLTPSDSFPLISHLCAFKGQIVGGNVRNGWQGCDATYYVWSGIGRADFTLDEQNESGFRKDPFEGNVLAVKRLGNNVVGYSTAGVTLITPANYPTPVMTFGFRELLDKGLGGPGAVGGNALKHLFLCSDYNLYELTEKGVAKVGYRPWMKNLNIHNVRILYDSLLDDFYISDGTLCYLLSPNGLTRVKQNLSAVWKWDTSTYGLSGTGTSDPPLLLTSPFDMGYRGDKTIFTIESDISNVYFPSCFVDWKFGNTEWKRSSSTPLNQNGVGTLIANGSTFRVGLTFADIENNAFVSYIKLRYKMTDLRFLRGVYAPPPRGQ